MVKLFIDLLKFLSSCAPLLTSLIILTVLCVLLSKSIKRHAAVYYVVLGIPFALVAIPAIGRMFGIEVMSFSRIPFLGEIIRDYIHMGTLGHPLLIIIMYMGALDPKIPNVRKLMTIRKELSIIAGFPVFAHSLIRVTNNFPNSLKYFTNHTEYMANAKVASDLGAGISNFSLVLGIVMLIIFIPLWVTSFDAVRKRMGSVKWKKLQKWSYVLYATLFIHAMGIQIGGMMNPRGGHAPKPAVEVVAATGQLQGENTRQATTEGRSGRDKENAKPAESGHGEQAVKPATGGRTPTKGFADLEVSAQVKRYIHLFSLILIYGSYLYLRLRKARKDANKKLKSTKVNA